MESHITDTLTDAQAAVELNHLADRLNVDVNPRKPKLDWEKALESGQAFENEDETLILKLRRPLEVDGEKVSRVTMGRVRVKDMRVSQRGVLLDLPSLAVSLVGTLFNELERIEDADLFLAAAAHQLGKFMGSSPSTNATPASSASSRSSAATSGSPRLI